MRILFWGTPDFSLPSLRALGEEGHEIAGVVTQPDRPRGRGRKLHPSPVKEVAREEGYEVLTPDRPRGEEFLARIDALRPEISVVVAYGHILDRAVLDVPEQGSINLHASLLPRLRGAAPITWAIARGSPSTGVTVMRMVEAMDAGPILFQVEEPIGEDETASELTARLSEVGAQALVEALALLEAGALEEEEQEDADATYAPKVDRETARVHWEKDAETLSNWIRAMDGVPGAWSTLDGRPVKLFRPVPLGLDELRARPGNRRPVNGPGASGGSSAAGGPDAYPPGMVVSADPDVGLVVAAGEGLVRIGEIQPAGKRRMPVEAWLRGKGVEEGRRFE